MNKQKTKKTHQAKQPPHKPETPPKPKTNLQKDLSTVFLILFLGLWLCSQVGWEAQVHPAWSRAVMLLLLQQPLVGGVIQFQQGQDSSCTATADFVEQPEEWVDVWSLRWILL